MALSLLETGGHFGHHCRQITGLDRPAVSSGAATVAFSCGSELEAAVRSKQETLKELEAEESVQSPRRKAELHVEDLRETIQAVSKADCKGACLEI